ncbi:hypothetical protein EAG_10065, partial [Camponotus floridanus]
SFHKRKKSAEIRYAALIAEKNIAYPTSKEILNIFQHIGKDPNVLSRMSMSRIKCINITNVVCLVEIERIVNNIQNAGFSIFINETL